RTLFPILSRRVYRLSRFIGDRTCALVLSAVRPRVALPRVVLTSGARSEICYTAGDRSGKCRSRKGFFRSRAGCSRAWAGRLPLGLLPLGPADRELLDPLGAVLLHVLEHA